MFPVFQCSRALKTVKIMTEKALELKLKKEVEKLGGLCLKLKTPGFTGIPDRLVLLPGGKVWFVEVKKPGEGETSKRQEYVLDQLENLGMDSAVIYNEIGLEQVINFIKLR